MCIRDRYKDFGVAPKAKADFAFLLHDLYHLEDDGIMTIVLPHGVLFRGGEEAKIRENLIEKNRIDAIIGLPENIFFGTNIATIIMVLKKNRPSSDVLTIDASKGCLLYTSAFLSRIRILKNGSSFIPQRRVCITDLWADCWSIRSL